MKRVKLLLTAFALFIAMGTPNVMAQGTEASKLSINLVGKWLFPNPKQYFEFKSDGTGTYRAFIGKEYKLGDTDYTYVVEAYLLNTNWKLEGDTLTITYTKIKRVVGDCSFYPSEYQKQIKAENDSLDNLDNQHYANGEVRIEYKIISFAPASMKVKFSDGEFELTRDVSGMSPQEQEQYKIEIAQWEKIKKEKEQAEYKAALERDNLQMAKLKMKAVRTGNQYDYWIIGYLYEFGEGNGVKTTICLDSALVWYKKAAAIDPKNQEYVTAVSHKIKTGGDYYQDKAKETIANAKKDAKKLGSKYGVTLVNNLINTGQIKTGTPLALLQELIPIVNRAISKDNQKLKLAYYEPSSRDMQQYGRTAKRVKILDPWGYIIYSLMIANGKVAAVYQQNTSLKIN